MEPEPPEPPQRSAETLRVERLLPAYRQVASQLRALIVAGDLPRGSRLPAEQQMASSFGVSRSTAREALRLLAAENLIEARRGVHGGVFVVHPQPADVEVALGTAVNLAASTNQLPMSEVFEMWQITQIPAAALAARRRTSHHVQRLMDLSAPLDDSISHNDAVQRTIDFHDAVLEAAGNRLLQTCSRPLNGIGADTVPESDAARQFLVAATTRHRAIADAIAAADARAARRTMRHDLQQPERYHALAPTSRARGLRGEALMHPITAQGRNR